MADKDVTDLVEFGYNDDECLPIHKCVCGQTFRPWTFIISIYPEMAYKCPNCNRELYFTISIKVFEVEEPTGGMAAILARMPARY